MVTFELVVGMRWMKGLGLGKKGMDDCGLIDEFWTAAGI